MRAHRTIGALCLVAMLVGGTLPAFGQGSEPVITAFPDGDPTSGRFVNLTRGLSSLGEGGTVFYIDTLAPADPAEANEFAFLLFDGDYSGLWDFRGGSQSPEVRFRLYADPGHDQSGLALVEEWSSADMVGFDNAYYPCTSSNSLTGRASSTTGVVNSADAWSAADGAYQYLLSIDWLIDVPTTDPTYDAMNCFKIVVQGQVRGVAESRYGFIGFLWGAGAFGYSDGQGGAVPWRFDTTTRRFYDVQPPTTSYNGSWHFHLLIDRSDVAVLNLWNGDFDVRQDEDDPHTQGVPDWAEAPPALPEGARPGSPLDDLIYVDNLGVVQRHPFAISDPGAPAEIYHAFSDGERSWTAIDTNASGDKEWENYQIAVDGFGDDPEFTVDGLPAGHYHWEMFGVDSQNTLFLRAEAELYSEFGSHDLGDRVWLDVDNSGGPDDLSEPGINGVTVNLYAMVDGTWVFFDSQETRPATVADPEDPTQTVEVDGYYCFCYLAAGAYRVEVDPSTLPPVLSPTWDLDGLSTPHRAEVELPGDGDRFDVDFGYASRDSGSGTGTIGYWKNHPEAWPVPTIRIGGEIWSRAAAIERMTGYKRSKGKEDDLFAQLVAAKLNVMNGNDDSCIAADIQAADEWLAVYDGQVVSARSAAWKLIEASFENLDDYNNGRLPCAGHRD